ncbi:hypothetical protein [Desulfofustis glycolicus]|uniref:Uncharacterized protein n=1 Tax=Desulfofustis glycolicus DSM 9705 TaxID=1121409 RepID=A0A1M5SG18_9BACT|nr:hypothetical protein [Desulfofustis glycolicus]SHH37466.1 hypothetical protein SAMN02745124_00332 [Desulfofustis glycolicus DSM 9705]
MKQTKEIHISCFKVTGTDNPVTANRAIQKLLSQERCGLKLAQYRIDGKTITIKPRTI